MTILLQYSLSPEGFQRLGGENSRRRSEAVGGETNELNDAKMQHRGGGESGDDSFHIQI